MNTVVRCLTVLSAVLWTLSSAHATEPDAMTGVMSKTFTARDAADLDAQVKRQLEAWLAARGIQASITGYLAPRARPFEFSHVLRMSVDQDALEVGRPASVRVKVAQDDAPSKRVELDFYLRPRLAALVALRSLPRNSLFRCSDFRAAILEAAPRHGGWLAPPCDDAGSVRQLRRPLGAGDALLAEDLGIPPLVTEGQQVQILVRIAAVSLESVGTALRDGGLGERIPVKPATSPEITTGVVLQPGVVALEGLR